MRFDVVLVDEVADIVAHRLRSDADGLRHLSLVDRRLALRDLDEDLVARRVTLAPEDTRIVAGHRYLSAGKHKYVWAHLSRQQRSRDENNRA